MPSIVYSNTRAAARAGRVSGAVHDGAWLDIGTPQRLAELEARMDGLEERRREASTPEERAAIVRKLRPLGVQRTRLKWGE